MCVCSHIHRIKCQKPGSGIIFSSSYFCFLSGPSQQSAVKLRRQSCCSNLARGSRVRNYWSTNGKEGFYTALSPWNKQKHNLHRESATVHERQVFHISICVCVVRDEQMRDEAWFNFFFELIMRGDYKRFYILTSDCVVVVPRNTVGSLYGKFSKKRKNKYRKQEWKNKRREKNKQINK